MQPYGMLVPSPFGCLIQMTLALVVVVDITVPWTQVPWDADEASTRPFIHEHEVNVPGSQVPQDTVDETTIALELCLSKDTVGVVHLLVCFSHGTWSSFPARDATS